MRVRAKSSEEGEAGWGEGECREKMAFPRTISLSLALSPQAGEGIATFRVTQLIRLPYVSAIHSWTSIPAQDARGCISEGRNGPLHESAARLTHDRTRRAILSSKVDERGVAWRVKPFLALFLLH